jgi:hypothetical protein
MQTMSQPTPPDRAIAADVRKEENAKRGVPKSGKVVPRVAVSVANVSLFASSVLGVKFPTVSVIAQTLIGSVIAENVVEALAASWVPLARTSAADGLVVAVVDNNRTF